MMGRDRNKDESYDSRVLQQKPYEKSFWACGKRAKEALKEDKERRSMSYEEAEKEEEEVRKEGN